MDRTTNDVINSVGGYEEFEKLVKRGRQMHDQAAFDLLARMATAPVRFVKRALGIANQEPCSMDPFQGYA